MAEEILLLTVKLQADSKNAKNINDLIKANKQLAKAIKDAPKEGAVGYKELEKELDAAKKQFADNKKEIDKFNKELNTGEKQVEANKTSLIGLSKTLKDLEKEYKLLSKEERQAARGKELQKSIYSTRQELLKAEKKLGDFRRQVGNYGLVVAGLSPQLSALGSSIGTVVSGFTGLTTAFKNATLGAKAFLLAMGPVAAVVTAVSFALSKFESVRESFERGFAGISAVANVVVERVGRAALAFNSLLSLDFKTFASEFGSAFTGLTYEIKNDFNAASEAMGRMQELEDREIENIVRLAELERDVSIAKREAEELSATDKESAILQVQRAIELTKEQFAIEVELAQLRADILAEQVDLKGATAKDEERRAVEEARANVVRLRAAEANELKGLTRRLNQLRKGVKEEQTALQLLLSQQSSLTEQLKEQILAGEDTTKTLNDLTDATMKLMEVDSKFKELTKGLGETTNFTNGSLQAYNKELEGLNLKLETLVIGSKEYEDTQSQILVTEANRSVAIGDITKSLEALNAAQQNNISLLEDSLTELRLRTAAQEEIESNQGAENAAEKRIQIEEKLAEDLKQLRINRINDEKAALDVELENVNNSLKSELELYADNEIKKQEISLIAQGKRDEIAQKRIELEAELLNIQVDNFKTAEEKKTSDLEKEEAKRKQLRELATETTIAAAGKVLELLGVLQKQATEKELSEIQTREEKQLKEAELLGKTEEQKQNIRDKFSREREAVEKKAAEERKALALAEATIDIAGAVIKGLNTAPPANVAFAAAAAALGAIQLAIIAATNFANGGLVTPVKLGNGKIVNSANIPQMSNGDNILATVKTGEVILNKRQQKALGGSETFRSIGVPGFAKGGEIKPISKAFPFASGGLVPTFRQPPIVARAFANGGAAISDSVNNSITKEMQLLSDMIYKAVRDGAAVGTKEGAENADITGQIAEQNKRNERRAKNESV